MANTNFKERICLITGANSGLGKAAAIDLAKLGMQIVMVCRNKAKGEKALAEIKERSRNDSIELLLADLSILSQVRKLADEFRARHEKLHVLINNAGLANLTRRVTADGFEETFEINYLAPFLLTNLLIGVLNSSAPSRVINVSSVAHYSGHIEFSDLQSERNYGWLKAYGQSKLALVLFTRELARILKGSGVTAYSLHPGAVATNIWTRSAGPAGFVMTLPKLFMLSPRKGAETIVYLASAEGVEKYTGEYFEKKQVKKSSEESYDEEITRRLWSVSETLTSLKPQELFANEPVS